MAETLTASELEQICRDFVTATTLSWEREDRFGVMLALIKADQLDGVQAELAAAFGHQFAARDDLPATPKHIVGGMGGMRSGQS